MEIDSSAVARETLGMVSSLRSGPAESGRPDARSGRGTGIGEVTHDFSRGRTWVQATLR